ncbi:hypothetical protein B9H04_06875 [Halorubrum ezzemoulense DSM 17463]|uniref:Uncharacterized protein n=1 Tax=Halorubrum ezzemoulense DSM 17463 TaxID=1121945 RepID=A0A1X4H8K6_HALEZ|nr:hypothetical protein B9H04_06875 [Halorubrum ezzemoulense DSM 17463]
MKLKPHIVGLHNYSTSREFCRKLLKKLIHVGNVWLKTALLIRLDPLTDMGVIIVPFLFPLFTNLFNAFAKRFLVFCHMVVC